jgi:hypothetical protein
MTKKSKIKNQKSKIKNQKSKIKNQKSKIKNKKLTFVFKVAKQCRLMVYFSYWLCWRSYLLGGI